MIQCLQKYNWEINLIYHLSSSTEANIKYEISSENEKCFTVDRIIDLLVHKESRKKYIELGEMQAVEFFDTFTNNEIK
jgi:hypothetical protein